MSRSLNRNDRPSTLKIPEQYDGQRPHTRSNAVEDVMQEDTEGCPYAKHPSLLLHEHFICWTLSLVTSDRLSEP